MIEISEILRDNITKDELIPAASLVLTLGVIVAGGYVMSYLVKIEEENVQKTLGAKGLKVIREKSYSLIALVWGAKSYN